LGVLKAQSSLSDERLTAVVALLRDEDWKVRRAALEFLESQSSLSDERLYNNPPMKTLILVKRLRLRHVLIRLPCLLFALPLHKQFPAAIIPPVLAANLLHLPLLGGFELGFIPHLNSPGTAPRELLGDRGPRKSLHLQLKDHRVVR
jgi:hypothetical protein